MRLRVTFAVGLALLGTAPIPSRAQAQVSVPIRVYNNHVYVRVMSGTREMWFLLDTGAPLSIMNLATADALGAQRGRQEVSFRGAGPGSTRGASLEGVRVFIREDTTLTVTIRSAMEMVALNSLEGVQVDGILGRDFIEQRVLALDYAQSRIVFSRTDGFRYAGTGDRVPLKIKNGYPIVVAELELADGGKVKADFELDVGATNALSLNKPLVEKHHLLTRVGPTIRRAGGAGAGGATTATTGRVPRFRIGKTELTNLTASLFGDSAGVFSNDQFFEGNIGGEILRRFTVIFDYTHKEVIFEPNADLAEPFEVDMSGAMLRLDNPSGGFRIVNVMPRGPAQSAGAMPGDLIVAVDGNPSLEYGIDALRKRFRQDGGEVALTIRRGTDERVIRIAVRRLV